MWTIALAIDLLAALHAALWQYDTNGASEPAEHVALIAASLLWPLVLVFAVQGFISRRWHAWRAPG